MRLQTGNPGVARRFAVAGVANARPKVIVSSGPNEIVSSTMSGSAINARKTAFVSVRQMCGVVATAGLLTISLATSSRVLLPRPTSAGVMAGFVVSVTSCENRPAS